MNFQEFQSRLVMFLRDRVRSGELTERGLARITRVSKPHIHNILKEKRVPSVAMADRILRHLRMDLLDLVRPDDVAEWHRRR
jgi:transcriptional regulator with XRE-family HTH domain